MITSSEFRLMSNSQRAVLIKPVIHHNPLTSTEIRKKVIKDQDSDIITKYVYQCLRKLIKKNEIRQIKITFKTSKYVYDGDE